MPKLFKRQPHHLPGAFTYREEGMPLRVNVNQFESGQEFPFDPVHYHETRTTFFIVLEGELQVEVSGEIINVTPEKALVVEPKEHYRTLGFGLEGGKFIVIGDHNEDDRIIV